MNTDPVDLGFSAALWRALDVVRILATVYAAIAFATRDEAFTRPWLGWLLLTGMFAWSVFLALRGRTMLTGGLIAADLGVAAGAVLLNPLIDTPQQAGATNTVALIWPVASVMAWAVWRGPWFGMIAGTVIGVCDLLVITPIARTNLHNIVLLLLCGGVVGFAASLYASTRREMAEALQLAAASRERERLARDIHDSVLQVLAFIQRRGGEIGGATAELGELAGEQEKRLRALVLGRRSPEQHIGHKIGHKIGQGAARRDVLAELRAGAGPRVQVSGPATPVLLGDPAGGALIDAARACLNNVERHAGPTASAFVLVEDEPEEIVVTVRDDGAGFAAGRLEQAEADGRLGMAQSIRGRIRDVGGRVEVWASPGQGVEVELFVPKGEAR